MNVDELPQEALDADADLVAQVLQEGVAQHMLGKRTDFALDLLSAKTKYGKWTAKQEMWARYMYALVLGLIATPAPKVEQVGDFSGVMKLFEKAKEHLKYPAIMLQTEDGQPVQLKLSGPTSKNPGQVNVTDGRPFGDNIWYGRVSPQGGWMQSNKVPAAEMEKVAAVLKQMSEDPVGTAKKHALLTGRCCFCNTPLTDKKSTAAGFGPVCAKNYGLKAEWNHAVSVFDKMEVAL